MTRMLSATRGAVHPVMATSQGRFVLRRERKRRAPTNASASPTSWIVDWSCQAIVQSVRGGVLRFMRISVFAIVQPLSAHKRQLFLLPNAGRELLGRAGGCPLRIVIGSR